MVFGRSGASPKYFALLHEAGIDRYEQLRSADPSALLRKLAAANDRNHLVKELPTREVIQEWINQAKGLMAELPRVEGLGNKADQDAARQVSEDDASIDSAWKKFDTNQSTWNRAGGPRKTDW